MRRRIASILFIASLSYFVIGSVPLWALAPIHRSVLPNKLVLLVSEEHTLPFVTLELLVDAGSRRDPSGQAGLAHFTAKGLLLGTPKYSVTAINEALDFMGASLGSSAGRDYATLGLRVLKKDLDKGLELLAEVITRPAFPGDEVRREKEKILAGIQAVEEQPDEVAEKAFQKNLFLNSPYGHPVEGTKESVAGIKGEDLQQFYRKFYHPNNAILAVAGDVTPEEIKSKLSAHLGRWTETPVPKESFRSEFAREPKTVKINRAITQANIILGGAGVSRENPDYYALTVMNNILGGGGLSSRLMQDIRIKQGLAYSVASYFVPRKYPGSFQVVLQTKNATAQESISLARKQIERVRKEPVSEDELARAKKYLIGSFPMRLDSQAKMVGFMSQVEYYKLGLDYARRYPDLIRAVTRQEVLRVAQKYLHPDQYLLVVVADLREAKME